LKRSESEIGQEVTVSKEAKQGVPETICSEYADDADLVVLIDEFASGLEADVESMRKVLENGDHDGLRRLALQIKGAAKAKDNDACMLTMDKFAILCQAVDRGRKVQL
jgi:hypothetical protein